MRNNSGQNHWRWKGGLSQYLCKRCDAPFLAKPSAKRKYCSLSCVHKTTRGVPNRNSQWKGSDVSYRTLHKWVERWKGKPSKCEECGLDETGKWYEWANISKEYKRELSDWRRLCRPCHREFDGSAWKSAATKRRMART